MEKNIYFPFGGNFTYQDIIERLKNLKIDNDCYLHLDLYNTDQIKLMIKILFSLLITRFYGQNEDIFFLSKDIPIKVEIPNTFIDFFEKLEILSLFPIKEIKISNLPPLLVPNQLDSNIQLVSNYLKIYRKKLIEKYDLFFPNITSDYFLEEEFLSNSIKAELLSQDECQKLIFDTINEILPNPSYYQIESFINILSSELKKLNQNLYYKSNLFSIRGKYSLSKRTSIIESFIKLTKYFIKGEFNDLIKGQNISHKALYGKYDENSVINQTINYLANHHYTDITFDTIEAPLLFFNEGDNPLLSIITNKEKAEQEYKDLLEIKNIPNFFTKNITYKLPNYREFTKTQFLQELKEILNLENPVEEGEKNFGIPLKEITKYSVISSDIFVKMILILLRIRFNIPVIIIGDDEYEIYSLISNLSKIKNNGNFYKMKFLKILEETTDKDIIKFIYDEVIPEALNLKKVDEKKFSENIHFFKEEKIWIFLDNINICKSMGFISELMLKHTCQGKLLPSNLVFIATCYPYRQRKNKLYKEKNKFDFDINKVDEPKNYLEAKKIWDNKKKRNNNLVYDVNLLPHSLFNFAFYFGEVNAKDQEEYIKNMIKYNFNNKEELEDEKINKLHKLAQDMIIASQNYIREIDDKSQASLKDIRKFFIFNKFFYTYLMERKNSQFYEEGNDFYIYKNLDKYLAQVYSINLSIFMCYYLKIADKEQRNCLLQKLNKIFKNFDKSFENKDFLDLPKNEELYIANNIKINNGIAKNRVLLENLFSIFVAINCKIPILIMGKPGSSKSLSVQLIIKSMQGSASKNHFFRLFPKILVHSYHCSMTSTYKGIENIFLTVRKKYRNLRKKDKHYNIIPLIYFDEIDFAEYSPNNPLKAIHSELEFDKNTGRDEVAFVGISRWIYDSTIMERGITILIPEEDEEDYMETSFNIGKLFNEKLAIRYKSFFENLGKSYHKYKLYLKQNHSFDGKEDFHCNRNFYQFVKNCSKNMLEKEKNHQLNEKELLKIADNSIERNFSGILFENDKKTSLEIFKEIFKEFYPEYQFVKQYDAIKKIKENLKDLNSRYLLVLTKSPISIFLLSTIFFCEKKEYSFFIGSQFEEDLNSIEYTIKVLNNIQIHMEKGNILILKNINSIYSSLYDLFDLNFTFYNSKSYVHLPVGLYTNTNNFYYVNNCFRLIIIDDILNNEETSFLNRFEKHIISFENILSNELIEEAEKIKSILNKIVKCDEKRFKAIPYELEKLLVNNNLEEIQGLIYEANRKGLNKEEINEFILNKFALTIPKDIIINMKINGLLKNKNSSFNKILELYNKGEQSNFSNFLKTMNSHKNIIYTFSNNFERIKGIDKINNNLIGTIYKKNIKQIVISSIKSERDLEREINIFFNEENYKICLVKLMPNEGKFMNYLKFFIDNKEKEKDNKNKSFIFIFYMTRILKKDLKEMDKKPLKEQFEIRKQILDESLSHLSGYYQVFIDNLNGDKNLKIEKIMNMTQNELFKTLVIPDEILCNSISTTINYMNYKIIGPYKEINKDNYTDLLIKFIYNNKRFRDLINECLFSKRLNKEENIIIRIFQDQNSFDKKGIEIISFIKKYLSKLYNYQLNQIFFKAEKDQFFSSLLSNSLEEKIWQLEKNNLRIKEEEISPRPNTYIKKEEIFEDKTIVEQLANLYLKDIINYDNFYVRIYENLYSNNLVIILGLYLPGIKNAFDKITKSVKENIIINYRKNENNLRNFFENEDRRTKETKNFFNDLKIFNNSLVNIIIDEPQIIKIIDIIKSNKDIGNIDKLIINDYYTLFLYNIGIFTNTGIDTRFLNLLVNLRNEIINKNFNNFVKETEVINLLANNINWIESYTEEIFSLQQIFLKLSLKIPTFFEDIEIIINKKRINYEITEKNPEYTSIVNEVFFLSIDSILKVLLSKEEIYNLNIDELHDLINIIKEIMQTVLKLENNLNIRSKEVFNFQEILKLINAFNLNNLASIENIKIIIKYFRKQEIYVQSKLKGKLCDNFNDFYKFLVENLGNIPKNKNFNFHKILCSIFFSEYSKIALEDFRELILQKILESNEFIANSSQIIKLILENAVRWNPSEINSNIDSLKTENSKMLNILNSQNNIFLDEIIMNIFEGKISAYFEWIPRLTKAQLKNLFPIYFQNIKEEYRMLLDDSFDIFMKTINFLDSISNLNNINKNKKNNSNLYKLFSIAYVKMYLSKLVFFIKRETEANFNNIIQVIRTLNNKNFSKVIKIYILKLFYYLTDNNFEEIQKFEFAKKFGFEFIDESLNKKESNKDKDVMLKYLLLPLDDEDHKKYLSQSKLFSQNAKFQLKNKDIVNCIQKDSFDIFICIFINKIISNLGLPNYDENKIYTNFSNYIKSLFIDIKLKSNKELCQLLSLFYDFKIYKKKIKPKLINNNKKEIDQKVFEALLYGFRFCANSLDINFSNQSEELLFSSIFSQNCSSIIEQSMIPGNDFKEDIHFINLEFIEFHLKTLPDACGCYVCSCGLYYAIDPSGFPTTNRNFKCPYCGEICGWAKKKVKGGAPNHGMAIRPGHLRIFRDKTHKEGQMRRWKDPDENIPNMILEDYKKNIIDSIRKRNSSGFHSIERDYFESQNKKVRNLSIIGYRLLNFISYCHLFFSYCIGNISEENMKNYLIKNTEILTIIEIDWNLLKESLKQKNINSIQIFMNLIFKKLSKLIKECKCFKIDEERIKFEKQVDDLIEQCIKEYPKYSIKYNRENIRQSELEINSLKALVFEVFPPTKEFYPEKDYPLFNYFILTNYKTEEDIFKKISNDEKYPLLNKLISGNPEVKKLVNLPEFNEFTNYMVDNYSLKITREYAKINKLSNMDIINQPEFKTKFNNFLRAWDEIKSEAIKYKCLPEMPIKNLSIDDNLIYFLNDIGELYNGMYLASAFQNFIFWQNEFLQPIVEEYKFNGILHPYVENIK